MKNSIKLLTICILTITSCTKGKEIDNYESIGEFKLIWYTDFGGKNGLNYYVVNSSEKLNRMFNLENDSTKELLEKTLEKTDLVISHNAPVSKILINTKFTRGDDCDYIKADPIEVVLDTENVKDNIFYIYAITPKGKYRIICP